VNCPLYALFAMKSIIKSIASLKLFFDLPDSIFAISSDKSNASYLTFNGICTGVQKRSISTSPPLFTSSGFFTNSIILLFKFVVFDYYNSSTLIFLILFLRRRTVVHNTIHQNNLCAFLNYNSDKMAQCFSWNILHLSKPE